MTVFRKFFVLAVIFLVLAAILNVGHTSAQSTSQNKSFYRGHIVDVHKQQGSADQATVKLLSGPDKGQTVTAPTGALISSLDVTPPHYRSGDLVLVSRQVNDNTAPSYVVVDHYRIPYVLWILAIILVVAVYFAGIRGIGSIVGLLLSVLVIAKFIIPQVLHGGSPYLATAVGIMLISGIGIFIAHGFSRRTSLALISTILTLIIAVGLAALSVRLLHLSGVSSEDIYLLSSTRPDLNIQGLLLCGTLITLIGVLDDITVGQAAAVEEIHRANSKLHTVELYRRGLRIGREHIASLINTLVLVYVGTSFLFIVYLSVISPYPLLVNLNSELIMEEIGRSLVGSSALILAVPLTTILTAKFLPRQQKKQPAKKPSAVSD
jgi:uncharacterized membrane protein